MLNIERVRFPDLPLAACRTSDDPDRWFPEHPNHATLEPTRQMCNGCPEQAPCLKYALDNRIPYGMWGGLTPDERRQILGRRPVPYRPYGQEPCGTKAAYLRHRRYHKRPCDLCQQAWIAAGGYSPAAKV